MQWSPAQSLAWLHACLHCRLRVMRAWRLHSWCINSCCMISGMITSMVLALLVILSDHGSSTISGMGEVAEAHASASCMIFANRTDFTHDYVHSELHVCTCLVLVGWSFMTYCILPTLVRCDCNRSYGYHPTLNQLLLHNAPA